MIGGGKVVLFFDNCLHLFAFLSKGFFRTFFFPLFIFFGQCFRYHFHQHFIVLLGFFSFFNSLKLCVKDNLFGEHSSNHVFNSFDIVKFPFLFELLKVPKLLNNLILSKGIWLIERSGLRYHRILSGVLWRLTGETLSDRLIHWNKWHKYIIVRPFDQRTWVFSSSWEFWVPQEYHKRF